MSAIIICSLALALVHFWILPASLNLKNFGYLVSNRDGSVETSAIYDQSNQSSSQLPRKLCSVSRALLAFNAYGD